MYNKNNIYIVCVYIVKNYIFYGNLFIVNFFLQKKGIAISCYYYFSYKILVSACLLFGILHRTKSL